MKLTNINENKSCIVLMMKYFKIILKMSNEINKRIEHHKKRIF